MTQLNEYRPQAGPQWAFAATPADVCFYGGQAGGGKSWGVVYDPLRHVHRPKFSAAYFRRTSPQLIGPGSLWDLSTDIYPEAGGVPREGSVLDWRFPSGAHFVFNHLQHAKDKIIHQGKQYAAIYFDELTHFLEEQFWYLLSRNRTMCGIRPYFKGTCNPDPDSFVRTMIDWYIDEEGYAIPERSGVLRWFVRDGDALYWADRPDEPKLLNICARHDVEPLSFTFINASLEDNQALMLKDPGYKSKLASLPLVERMQLLGGNWNIRAAAGNVFKKHWFAIVDELTGEVERTARAWDKAATEPNPTNKDPDWTRGVRISKMLNGPYMYIVEGLASLRGRPAAVDRLMRNTAAQDGAWAEQVIFQDPGAAGVTDRDHTAANLDGADVTSVRPTENKKKAAGPFSSACERGAVALLRGDWNTEFIDEHEAFPTNGVHDDIVDAAASAYNHLSRSTFGYA